MERHARPVSKRPCNPRDRRFSAQKMAGYGVAPVAAVLVLYPVFFLFQASLDVGDPQVRPPTAYGLDNFNGMLQLPADPAQYPDGVGCRHGDGAGVRLRDGVDPDAHQRARPPSVRTTDGGALLSDAVARRAGLEPARRTGKRLHQPGLARARRQRPSHRYQYGVWNRLGHGAVRGLGRLRHDRRGHEVDGPRA